LPKNNFEYKPKSSWVNMSPSEKDEAFSFAKKYIDFMNRAHTERQCTNEFETMAKNNGFISINEVISQKGNMKPGDKLYLNVHGKSILFAVIGNMEPQNGFNIIGAHLDSPRLDFKTNPLYSQGDYTYAKTHYYGGIKKYQWVTIPLAIHGVIIPQNGIPINVSIGDDDNDPVFTITDLLPHLAKDQMEKIGSKVISGENLNVLLGSMPESKKENEDKEISAKSQILAILNEKYGISERDFACAELEVVPAYKAKEIGLDRSMIGAYAQDDRVCAYAAFMAMMQINTIPQKTSICYLSDKEEVGSMGNTGAESVVLENFISELCYGITGDGANVITSRCMTASRMLSADVSAAFDTNFEEVADKNNEAYLGRGVAIEKYTGARGKSGASDANPEFVRDIVNVFDKAGVSWQISEMGKVDQGGGGTIAQYMANRGINVIDCGVPVLSMHAPFEITSKSDLYWAYKAYRAFYKK